MARSETSLAPSPGLPLNQIICGDNCEVMRAMPSGSIDLVVTSPPYDDLRTYSAGNPIEELWDFEGVAQQLWRVTKPGGVVVWVVNDASVNGSETGTSFRQALRFKEIGFRLHDTMIYQKSGVRFPDAARYHQTWEYMFVFSVGSPKTFNPICDRKNKKAGKQVGNDYKRNKEGVIVFHPHSRAQVKYKEFGQRFNAWTYNIGGGNSTRDKVAYSHPAIFPDALARDHILSWSNEGDVVLDPFAGSFTTCKAAKLLGRNWVGIELNPDYCAIGKSRLAQAVLDFSCEPITEETHAAT